MSIDMRNIRTLIGKTTPTVGNVVVRPFAPDDTSSPKGSRTWNFLHPLNAPAGRTMIALRYKGEEVGNHFHGPIPDKDPETFLVVMGRIKFWFRDLLGGFLQVDIDTEKDGPTLVLIPAFILHGVVVESDTALYLEQQSQAFNPHGASSASKFEQIREGMSSEA